jgi:hypothetical protein
VRRQRQHSLLGAQARRPKTNSVLLLAINLRLNATKLALCFPGRTGRPPFLAMEAWGRKVKQAHAHHLHCRFDNLTDAVQEHGTSGDEGKAFGSASRRLYCLWTSPGICDDHHSALPQSVLCCRCTARRPPRYHVLPNFGPLNGGPFFFLMTGRKAPKHDALFRASRKV